MKNFFKFLPIFVCLSISAYAASTTKNIPDQEIAQKVNERIGRGWFSPGYDQVTVQVKNGVVTLTGYVKTDADKEKVEREVRNTNGVINVESKIRVQDPSTKKAKDYPQDTYSSASDQQLNKKIRDHVSNGWIWDSYKDMTLNTSNGVVTLEGTVKTMKDQQKIMTAIQKIPGVRSVDSNLRIQEEEK